MKQDDKLKVYEKFKERSDAKVIKNEENVYPFGTGDTITTIAIKELTWSNADKLEDKIIGIIKNVQTLFQAQLDDEKIAESLIKADISELLNKFKNIILKDGLLDLAGIISNGEITMAYINEKKATKSQVIEIVTEGMLLNYSYIKNLIPLAGIFK